MRTRMTVIGLVLGVVTLCTITATALGIALAVYLRFLDPSKPFLLLGRFGLIGALAGSALGSGALAVGAVRRKLVAASGSGVGDALKWLGAVNVIIGAAFWSTAFYGLGDYLYANAQILLVTLISASGGLVVGLAVGLLALIVQVVVNVARAAAGLARPASTAAQDGGAMRRRPLSIEAAAALLPAGARGRWLESVDEATHDYPAEEHRRLLRDFIAHAPTVIAWAWALELRSRALGIGARSGSNR
ncbi:hypothetical protein [Streptomyces sp. MJM1172]|uniref:hypothetical protein n=1 Tax=Streptomyces sp. MJM1172 TaxID=1703926 RepID=UPI00093AD426|nr:hypothetical protein [Streptomyces sp. MJM1172]OKI52992.1 hypothetical protein AMK15_29470 [Streptomyces sp. MJM1172]